MKEMKWTMYPPNTVIGKDGDTTVTAMLETGPLGAQIGNLHVASNTDINYPTLQNEVDLTKIRDVYRQYVLAHI